MENNNYQYRYWRELDQMKIHVFNWKAILKKR
jgi:hypothetical protein